MTVLLAATPAADGGPGGDVILFCAAVAWGVGYVFACAFWPYKACRKCKGAGKMRSPSGRAWRKCPRCKGATGRIRFGRHVWNFFHKTKTTKGRTR